MPNSNLYEAFADALAHHWVPRENQKIPAGDAWSTWLILAGRSYGKTKTGAESIRIWAESGAVRHIALVGRTAADVRDTMIEGPAGLCTVAPEATRPHFYPSMRRLVWHKRPGGPPYDVTATLFSSDEPDQLRGPQHDAAWIDEMASYGRNLNDTWANLQMGMRLGKRPRQIITTTPRPLKLLAEIMKSPSTVTTRGSTYENRANLPENYFTDMIHRYEGTRLGRQELMAEMLDDVPGALWTRDMIDRAREPCLVPPLERVVVSIDPSGAGSASDDKSDAIGIVVCGKAADRCYVLADWTIKASPDVWGRRAVEAYRYFNADRIVAERNFGGAMVEHVIRTVDRNVAYKEVSASRGKVQRAEPVAALYEQGRVSHVGDDLTALEDQLCAMTATGFMGDGSPDRADALVWALTELMVLPARPQFIWSSIGDQDHELEVARRHLVRGPY
jgi:phage terminase large subunit-like protein